MPSIIWNPDRDAVRTRQTWCMEMQRNDGADASITRSHSVAILLISVGTICSWNMARTTWISQRNGVYAKYKISVQESSCNSKVSEIRRSTMYVVVHQAHFSDGTAKHFKS